MNSHSDNERTPVIETESNSHDEKRGKVYFKLDNDKFKEQLRNRITAGRNILGIFSAANGILIDKLKRQQEKQIKIDEKITRRERKVQRLENKAARLEETNKMLDRLAEGKETPTLVKLIREINEQKISRIRDVKIPKNNQKIESLQAKGFNNQRKIRATFAKIDKLQALSGVIGSFAVLNPEKRREAFAQSLDALHDASKRAIQCKIEKCDTRIEKLQNSLPEKNANPSLSDINTEDKISALNEKRDELSQKLNTLEGLEKPFAEQDKDAIEIIAADIKPEVESIEQNAVEQPDAIPDIAEDMAVRCTEKANEAARSAEKSYEIIGNTKYDDISDKFYVNLTAEKAREVAKLLDENGIQFSGTIRENGEAKITLDKADIKSYKRITGSSHNREQKPSVLDEINQIKAEQQKSKPQQERKTQNQEL